MPLKRQHDDAGESSARERKKIKVADARTIHAQDAGSSKTAVQFNSMQGLPASIDVERFTEARAYEIDAMEKAIKTASESSTHRAWQTLPRHLRRRAASHDVRRVPQRLRDKARAEMDTNQRRPPSRPKRGKANQITRTEDFLKRQRDKSWLETHIWHAKRAKMQNMWGYRLPVTPTEKAFRSSHRASLHSSILHDASYYATIELKGPKLLLQALLERCCEPRTIGMKRSVAGASVCETHVYKHANYPLGLLGPMTIIWRPYLNDASHTQEQSDEGKSKGKGKEKQTEKSSSSETNDPRVVWIRCHPAIFEGVFESLRASGSYILEQSKKKDPQVFEQIELADLRGCINAFEIMGPRASQVIKGALSPAGNDNRKDVKKFWESLTDLQTSGSVPRGMMIGLKVLDPRLKFPPKNAKPNFPDVTQPSLSAPPPFIFPSASTAQSEIWDEELRGSLKKPKYKKKDIDERRSKNLVPGTPLHPLRQDDRVPILLIQRSVEPNVPSSGSTSQSDDAQGIHGWTLLFPAGWAMAFLSSLIYTGTRFAGQRERMKQFFEAGVGGFPNDYPTVAACDHMAHERAEEEKARWERTPPAKKPNYDKLGTRSPWLADWGVVLGLEEPPATNGTDQDLVTTQRENPPDADGLQTEGHPATIRPWLLRGSRVPAILSNIFITPAQFRDELNALRARNHMAPLDTALSAENLMRSALIMVRAKMVRRGAPSDMANMYKMDDPEARQWLKAFEAHRPSADDSSDPEEHELGKIKSPQTDVIGYVTTGDVSLTRGEGFAIGAIPVMQYCALRKQALRLSRPCALVKIRDRESTTCRAAWLELLDG